MELFNVNFILGNQQFNLNPLLEIWSSATRHLKSSSCLQKEKKIPRQRKSALKIVDR